MKHFFSVFILSIIAVSYSYANNPHERHQEEHKCNHHVCHDKYPYYITPDKVYYDGHEIKDASAQNFEILIDGYAKDIWSVYYCGNKIANASSSSFKPLTHGYAKDNWNAYYDGKKIEGASPDSFKVLRDGYAKDNWNTYYRGKKIEN